MTPEQINQRIAEACGWIKSNHGWWQHPTLPDNGGAMADPPDYMGDLNACAEFGCALTGTIHTRYLHILYLLCGSDDLAYIHATAPQRCEGFLRTLGLWEEAK